MDTKSKDKVITCTAQVLVKIVKSIHSTLVIVLQEYPCLTQDNELCYEENVVRFFQCETNFSTVLTNILLFSAHIHLMVMQLTEQQYKMISYLPNQILVKLKHRNSKYIAILEQEQELVSRE